MPRPAFRLALALALPFAAACGAARAPSAATASWDDATRLVVDSAAGRLAELELRRAALGASVTAAHPEARLVAERIAAVEAQLAALPHPDAARARATARVLAALDARAAGLAVERGQQRVTYRPDSPQLQRLDAEARLLAARRSELAAVPRAARR